MRAGQFSTVDQQTDLVCRPRTHAADREGHPLSDQALEHADPFSVASEGNAQHGGIRQSEHQIAGNSARRVNRGQMQRGRPEPFT